MKIFRDVPKVRSVCWLEGWRRWGIRGLTAVFLVGAGGCASEERPAPVAGEGARLGPGYPPGSADWGEGARVAYRTAFIAGMQDQREGYRFNDDRGALVLDPEVRGFYRKGYRQGYYHDATVRHLKPEVGSGE